MNVESNRRIEVARSEEEMYERLEQMKTEGYAESDIHVISSDRSHMHTLNRYSEVSTHEAGSFMDKFKSWFTGEDSIKEGLRKLDINNEEREKYSREVASGGFVLYTDQSPILNEEVVGSHQNEFEEGYDTFGSSGNSYESYHNDERPVQAIEPGFEERPQSKSTTTFNGGEEKFTTTAGTEFVASRFSDPETSEQNSAPTAESFGTTTFGAEEPRNETIFKRDDEEPHSEYATEQGFEPSTNEFVNETDGRFDEPQDRFSRGETFATDPYMAREKDHIGHSMQEDRNVQEHRPSINETITNEQQTDGYQSPGADPNLGPAAFGSDVETEFPKGEFKTDFEKDPRTFENQSEREEYTTGKLVGNEEDVTTNQYKERLDNEKYRADVPPTNKLL